MMGSLVKDFQRDIVQSSKSVTELLLTAKLISIKLGLSDITEWASAELGGYRDSTKVPVYRSIPGGQLQVLNPMRGWIPAGQIRQNFPVLQPSAELEAFAESESVVFSFPQEFHYPLGNDMGMDISHWQQQVKFSPVRLKGILSAIRDRLLEWSGELEKRDILGEDMSFDADERKSAQGQIFNIQHVTGVVGNVSHSNFQVYDYSSIHQTLKETHVPQSERNDLENIMDELKVADPNKKPPLIERAKSWITKNAEFLGASASIVRKALGIES
jgi:AbiTii